MKIKHLLLIFLNTFFAISQTKQGILDQTNWTENWTNFKPQTKEYRDANFILTGNIDVNTTLTKDKVYLLAGTVRVIKNATLTIEPGTVIRGDYETNGALMVTKGAKIIAKGTKTDPIIFTSNKKSSERKAGDWGGIIILGKAGLNTLNNDAFAQFDLNTEHNAYGGKFDNDDSGILQYVRVEFAGKLDPTGYSPNGISFCGVGSKTIIENISIAFCFDDSCQIYGGNLTLSNIVSFAAKDDDFDITQGSQFTLNNCLIVRNPFISDTNGSRAFEVDSSVKNDYYNPATKKTLAKLNNITVTSIERENDEGLIKEAILLTDNTLLEINNSVISGFKNLICFESGFFKDENYQKIKVNNLLINKSIDVVVERTPQFENRETIEIIKDLYKSKYNVVQINKAAKDLFINTDVKTNPDFRLK